MGMHDLGNLIHKRHYILLQDFCDLIEPSDIAKPKDVDVLIARDERIKVPSLTSLPTNIRGNDLGSSHPETQTE